MKNMIITTHAVERYIERVKPSVSKDAARAELAALGELAGEPAAAPPAWAEHLKDGDAIAFLEVSDGILLTLQPCDTRRDRLAATSVLTRAGMSDDHRARRNEKKAKRRARARDRGIEYARRGRPRRDQEEGW